MAIIQIQSIGNGSAWKSKEDQEMLIGAVFETTEKTKFKESYCTKSVHDVKPLKLANGIEPRIDLYSFFDIEYKILFK